MATRERAGDRGAEDAKDLYASVRKELRAARRQRGLSLKAAAGRAGVSPWQLGRLERGGLIHPTLDQVCRTSRAVGLRASLKLYPDGVPVRDAGQLALLGRFEALLVPGMPMGREIGIPLPGDLRAWDGRIRDGVRTASIEAEMKLDDIQAISRRIALKQRDDPDAGSVILLVNRTAHNRRILAEHREALRVQFPLDGAAILRDLRLGRIPPASGILLL
jgi:transcriptional regulator with XRE-family HTH domain